MRKPPEFREPRGADLPTWKTDGMESYTYFPKNGAPVTYSRKCPAVLVPSALGRPAVLSQERFRLRKD